MLIVPDTMVYVLYRNHITFFITQRFRDHV